MCIIWGFIDIWLEDIEGDMHIDTGVNLFYYISVLYLNIGGLRVLENYFMSFNLT